MSIPRDLDHIADDRRAVFYLAGFGDVVPEGLHVPGGGWAAFGAEAAVETNVFVLDHDAAGLESVLNVQRLAEIERRHLSTRAEIVLFAVRGKRNAACGTDVDACVALDALRRAENGLHFAI